MATQPTIYLPHGGGPWPWIADMAAGTRALRTWLESLPSTLPEPPRAILCVTAHWEAPVATVSTASRPGMLYDYGGFPAHTYQIQWPAPGAPDVAGRVRALLGDAGIPSAEDASRGFDHGTFVPLAVAWPGADVPTVQLSLVRGLDPALHLRIGRALRPLRDEGVLIVGSGMSYHNMQGFFDAMRGGPSRKDAEVFDTWLADALVRADRDTSLTAWDRAPRARASHPREEHLLPLMVVAGAAEGDDAQLTFRDDVLGVPVCGAAFG
ncbi:MAG: dioxygenase [Alphaproteobacteria bacterium]|nr:dioxygenase [Alphaproteobacteria bacterium]